jgi:lipoate-protein ligase A
MAWDEALLHAVGGIGTVVLRTYGWSQPAATFGYAQRLAEVAAWTPVRPLVRRPTGGGLVSHLRDWTYALVIPPDDTWYGLEAKASYRRLHDWVREALATMGVGTELATEPEEAPRGQCFLRAEVADLVLHGAKIAGAAQRRNRKGLLIQGSVQCPGTGLEHEPFANALRAEATRLWKVGWEPLVPGADLQRCASELVESKYSQDSYNGRR